jgi:hypothetical protein
VIFVTGHAKDPDVRKDMTSIMADSTMVGPSLYLEKPVTPEGYLNSICKILDVARQEAPEDANRVDELRRQAEALLESADAETIEALLKQLKRVGKP